MSKKCSINANVKNGMGEIVESKLFKDLLLFTGNDRETTKQYYQVGTDAQFITNLGDKAVYDDNGELTFACLKEFAGLKVDKVAMINGLNTNLEAGNYAFDEALNRIKNFNEHDGSKNKYLATMQAQEGGNFRIHVVEKNDVNIGALEKQIHNKLLKDNLEQLLTQHGLNSDFLNDPKNILYHTENITDIVEGVYQMLKVSQGVKVSEELATKAGKIILNTLKNSPFVDRLINAITPAMQQELLGDQFASDTISEAGRKELAAIILGKVIANKMHSKFSLTSLVERIIKLAKTSFQNMSQEQLAVAGLQARNMAAKITGSQHINTKSRTTEQTKKDHYSANITRYKRNIAHLKRMSVKLRSLNSKSFKRIDDILNDIQGGAKFNLVEGELADALALEGLVQMVDYVTDTFSIIGEQLASIDYDNLSFLDPKFSEYAEIVRDARVFYDYAMEIVKEIQQAEESLLTGNTKSIPLFNKLGEVESKDLMEMTSILKNLLDGPSQNSFKLSISNAEFALTKHFLTNFYGKDYVEMAATKTFGKALDLVNGDGKLIEKYNNKKGKFVRVKSILHNTRGNKNETVKVTFDEILREAPRDLTRLERWITPASNSPDNILQITDSLIKMANRHREEKTMEASRYLHLLRKTMMGLGLKKQSDLYEVSMKTGLRTHNFVTKLCWADYEQDYKDFRRQVSEDFQEQLDTTNKTKQQIQSEFVTFLRPLEKQFHETHSIYNKQDKMMTPNNSYLNPQYEQLFGNNPQLETKYKELLDYKKGVDDTFLPKNSSTSIRAPQIRNTVWQTLKNEIDKDGFFKGSYITFASRLQRTVGITSEDRDFGSKITDNELADQDFIDFEELLEDAPDRIPLYGINPIANTAELSEDIFGSLLIYSDMAHTHYAMGAIRSPLEMQGEVLKRRKDKTSKETYQINARFKSMMDKHVFGVGVYRVSIGKMLLNKISSAAVMGGSVVFLAGNTTGGIVNVLVGASMILNDAYAGEDFSIADTTRANRLYFQNLLAMIADFGSPYPNNKMSLFMDYMDTQSRFGQNLRSYETNKSRARNIFSTDLLFLPYSMGDHYMQGIPFLSTATKLKVYLQDGQEVSFYDALQVTETAPGQKGSTKQMHLPTLLFKSQEGRAEYYKLQTLMEKLDENLTLNLTSDGISYILDLTMEEEKYLTSKGLGFRTTQALKNAMAKLEIDQEELTWTTKDTAQFIKKNKDTALRLHGLMNAADKTELQQNILGQLYTSLKSYVFGYYLYHFGSQHQNLTQGRDVEGIKVTLAKVINYLSPWHEDGKGNKANFLKTVLYTMFIPNNKNTPKYIQEFKDAHFSENQFRNMKRQGMETYILLLMNALHWLAFLMKPGADDDDEEKLSKSEREFRTSEKVNPSEVNGWGVLYYLTGRVLQERVAWSLWDIKKTFSEGQGILQVMPPAVAAALKMVDLIYKGYGALAYEYVSPADYKRLYGEPISEEQKAINTAFFETSNKYHREKGEAKFHQDLAAMTYDRWSQLWYNGYEAWDNFLFGQKVRTR